MQEGNCLHTLDVTEDDGRGREELHPMCNPVVLKRFFAVIPVQLIPNFRLVCKLWLKMTLARWRNEVTYTFSGFSSASLCSGFFYDPPEILPQFVENPGDYISSTHKFLHFIGNPANDCETHPFRKFQLIRWPMQRRSFLPEKFYAMCAQYITDLRLEICIFDSVAEFRQTCFGTFPALRKLNLANMDFNWSQGPVPVEPIRYTNPDQCLGTLRSLELDLDNEDIPITWMDLLSHYPNLTEFKVYNAASSTLEKILTAVKVIRNHDRKLLKITQLDILKDSLYAQQRISDVVAVLLQEANLPLEDLTIDLGVEMDEEKIRNILASFAPTLKKLTVYRGPLSDPYSNFPFEIRLESLQELSMSDRLCISLDFMKFTPNLEKLWIYDPVEEAPPIYSTDIINNTDLQALVDVKLKNCVDLRMDYQVGSEEIQILIDCLPNIAKLRMPLDKHQFKLVCGGWSESLRDLEVLGDDLDDSVVTGLDEDTVEVFNQAEADADAVLTVEAEEFTGINLDHVEAEQPNITNLKYLRRFVMVNGGSFPTKLKDCSVFYGFLKLPRLEYFTLSSSMKLRAKTVLMSKLLTCEILGLQYDMGSASSWEMIPD